MIPGYAINASVSENPPWHLYRGVRSQDQRSVLIRTAQGPSADPRLTEQLESEFDTLRNINTSGVVTALDLVVSADGAALILADPGGSSLEALLASQRLATPEFLRIAVQLTAIIADLHGQRIVHTRLQPDRVLLGKDGHDVWLAGFEHALHLKTAGLETEILKARPSKAAASTQHRLVEGNLAYIAPEQTGRMDADIDYRTDLYSLGAIFYHMLTGRPPFDTQDPMALVHCHLARIPQPPSDIDPNIPGPLSDIVRRLLMKKADERYKSAQGVLADLQQCDQQSRHTGAIGSLTLATHDRPEIFEISDRLYGRSAESARLMAAFDSVCDGDSGLVLVSGYSGVGKTSLIKQFREPVVQRNGYFVCGKYDQLERSNPYRAILQAFWELVTQLLTETDAEIAQWKQRILAALGGNAQVIIEVVPELELIIGRQPPVAELKPQEAQNRFNFYFQKFITVFARPERPLVLFLDDLQWASMSSIRLFQRWVSGIAVNGLLMIGAYRDNEVDSTHPLRVVMGELREAGVSLEEIVLKPLDMVSLSRIIQDTLGRSETDSRALARCVRDKTEGNPFFARSFLRSLYEEGQLYIDKGSGWSWNIDAITSLAAADNVVDLMTHKIERLPTQTRETLKLAACIGHRFTLAALATASGKRPGATEKQLKPALLNGLIRHQGDHQFAFYHDRIQEAAYGLIAEEKRGPVHYQIGSLLYASASAEQLDEQLFEIVNHLNIGNALIADAAERQRLAHLNLRAGLKAKTSTAYGAAHGYFGQGCALLPSDPWAQDYQLAFDLHRERSECAYLCGRYEEAEAGFDLLMAKARSKREQAVIHNMRIIQYENLSRFPEAAAFGRQGLALFDIRFPESEQEKLARLDQEIRGIRQQLGGRSIADLVHLPALQDADVKICMRLLMNMWAPTYISGDIPMTMLIAASMVRLSLQHGNTEESAYGYVTYAINIAARNDDYRAAYEFGQLALAVNRSLDDLTARAKVNHMFSCYICPWREHIKACFKYSRSAYEAGMQSGDFTYGGYGGFHESWHALFSGMKLETYIEQYSAKLEFLSGYQYQSIGDAHQLMLQWGRCLQGETAAADSLDGNGFSEQQYADSYRDVPFFIAFYYVAKLNLSYLMMDLPAALGYAEQAETVIHGVRGMIWDALLCFNHALALTAIYPTLEGDRQAAAWEKLEALRARMGVWADNAPQNFAQQHDLVQAEMARIQGRYDDAVGLYDGAIMASQAQGFVNIEALAYELCGRFWLQRKQPRVAGVYLADAINRYRRWGAHGKVSQLETTFSDLLGSAVQRDTMTAGASPESLDVTAILKVSQAISGEMVMDRLVERLMQIVLENAGAERGLLLCLQEQGHDGQGGNGSEWRVHAQGAVDGDTIAVTLPAGDAQTAAWSGGVVNYVSRTHGYLLSGDAGQDDRLSADAYIRQHQIRSVLCVPILHQQQLTAILYLENNLTSGAFTAERVLLVQVLASQAATALENARLYSDVMIEIDERRQAESALRAIASGTASVTGEDFFRSLVQSLASSLDVQCVFAAECIDPGNRRVRTLAFMNNGRFTDNIEFDVAGTPCEGVVQGNACYYPENLAQCYPMEKGFESYMGAPAIDLSGRVLGHLAILDSSDMRHLPHADSILRIFATRVGVELHRKRTQEALQASEEKYRLLVENQQELVTQLDAQGRFEFVSPSLCELFGRTEKSLLGTKITELVERSDRQMAGEAWAALGKPPHRSGFEHRARTARGWRWLSWSHQASVDDRGCIQSAVCVGRDVTERREAEENARQTLQELAHLSRVSSMGEMASAFAHEVNQPLCAILSFAQACLRLLGNDQVDIAEPRHALERIAANAELAGNIIQQMRNFLRKGEPEFNTVDILPLLQESILLAQVELRDSSVEIQLECEQPLPQVNVNATQIEQVILNYLRNARDAILAAGIEGEVRIEARRTTPRELQISICDSGPGISQELLGRMFDPFVTSKAVGIGIGLSICKSIVESHGGRVAGFNHSRGGACFQLTLPLVDRGGG